MKTKGATDFQLLFQAMPGNFAVVLPDDPTFTVIAASDDYLNGARISAASLVGKGIFAVFESPDPTHTATMNELRLSFARVLATGKPDAMTVQRYDLPLPGAEGTGLEVHFWRPLNSPVLDSQGVVQFIIHRVEDVTTGVVEDIAAQMRAAEEMRQQWSAFDTALSNTPDFTYTFDLEGRFTYVNRALLSLWQIPLAEALGKNFFDLQYPDHLAARLQRQIQEVIQTRDTVRDVTDFTGPTGETRHYEYIFVPVLNAAGNVEGVAGSTRDITDRKRVEAALQATEAALRHSNGRLQAAFSQAPVAILMLRGPEMIVELANPSYQRLLMRQDMIGRPFREVLPEVGPQVWDAFRSVMETGVPFIANEFLVAYDRSGEGVKEDHWFNVAYNPLREADGAVSGIIAVLTDVTAQVVARKQLESVNRQLEEFAHVSGHDLQEPLRMVNIYTQRILKLVGSDDPQIKQSAHFVHQGVMRMETLLKDLLTFSRTVHSEEFAGGEADLNASVYEAMSALKGRIEESRAAILVDDLPAVRGDTGQMTHVMQNLLSNALKYRRAGIPPEIYISAELCGERWVVSVRDNGIGFDQLYAERIFGLFKRLHGSEEYSGTGLGLAICRRIIERQGGKIWAESRIGLGSTFRFSLPQA